MRWRHPWALLGTALLAAASPRAGCTADAGGTDGAALTAALPHAAQAVSAAAPASAGVAAESLSLAQAHGLALKNHPNVAAADYRAQAATEVFRQVRSGLLPQLNLYGSAVHAESENTRILAGGLNNPSVLSRAAYGAGVSQLITDFGRTTNLVQSSRLEASAEGHNAQTTREQVLLEVDRAYFGVLEAQALEHVARQTLDTRQLLLERVSILAQNKLKSDLDVSFARVALEDARLLQQKAQNDFDSSEASLATALGLRAPQHFSLLEATPAAAAPPGDVASLTDKALRDRPELGSLRDARDAAEHLARSLRDARLPTLSAVIAAGDAPSHDVRLPGSYSAGGLQLSMPVFAGGLYRARQHEAELRARAAAEALRSLEDQVSRDVRIAWLNLNNARERLRTTQALSRYAADAYQLADARYRAGSSSIVELSQAQLELTSAQLGEATARYEVLMQQSALNYETGAALADPGDTAD